MDVVIDSVNKIEAILSNSGCDDCDAVLDIDPDTLHCQFERGACISASFGGKSADFVTSDPLCARIKISFMFGASLDTEATRGAACAVINAVTGFFSLTRVHHPCRASCHSPCMELLKMAIEGKRIECIGEMPAITFELDRFIVKNHSDADIILITGDGLVDRNAGDIFTGEQSRKKILCLGPSTAGVARLQQLEHWCPYGQS
ncbi:MAG: hypothetical protein METHP_00606 [Methanoregula sp. SKADARSKE-2]|nr:MAG: hypothetical protein METHP_00606 [Methanoregula sp. SKADARSKE-2]